MKIQHPLRILSTCTLSLALVACACMTRAYAQPPSQQTCSRRELTKQQRDVNQPTILNLLFWNHQIIAHGCDHGALKFWQIDPSRKHVEILKINDTWNPLALATYQGTHHLALCRDDLGLHLFSITQERMRTIELPRRLKETKQTPLFAANETYIVIVADQDVFSYCDGTWRQWTVSPSNTYSFESVLAFHRMKKGWQPEQSVLIGDVLYLGYDRGEFGGGINALNVKTSEIASISYRNATRLTKGPGETLWLRSETPCLGRGSGTLKMFDGKKWTTILKSGSPDHSNNVNWPHNLADVDALTFDDVGRLHVLSRRSGIVRHEGDKLTYLTPGWPFDLDARHLLITPDNKGIIGLHKAGILIWDFDTQNAKRITLEHPSETSPRSGRKSLAPGASPGYDRPQHPKPA